MAGFITPEFKDRLLARLDIVEVVQARVPLKRAGKDFRACCPFHDEKTPSFYVSPAKQFYHCFGCGAGGNAIDFLIEYDRLGFREAVEELAASVGLDLPTDGAPGPAGPDPAPLYDLLTEAATLYRAALREHPEAAGARDYLKGRGLTGAIAARFGLGFAPPGWDFLLRRLGTSAAAQAQLVAAGLLVEADGGRRYDRFRDRVMFPIHDRRGRVIGFGGRVLGDGEPKYLNSPETPVFHKGRELYGLWEAQQARRKPERLLVVEGYLDVIALAQFGIEYAVATLGTATTPEHLRRLMRSAPELVFCFDGDRAGRAAAWKALETALPLATGARPVRFLLLPEGEDPDTLVRQEGSAAFARRIEGATLLSDFLLGELQQRHPLATVEGRSAFSDEASRLLGLVPAGSFRDQLAAELERRVPRATAGAPPPVRPGGAAGGTSARASTGSSSGSRAPALRRLTSIRLAIALLLDDPGLAGAARERPADWRTLDNPGVALLAELLDMVSEKPDMTPARLREHWRGTAHEGVCGQLSQPHWLEHLPAGRPARAPELAGAIDRLNEQVRRSRQQARLLALAPGGG